MRMHASCVAYDGRAVLILGAAGSGKSALALQLMAYGAALVSDDQTLIEKRDGWPIASVPPTISGMIEARGVGLLAAVPARPTRIVLVVDLDQREQDRLPPARTIALPGRKVPLLHNVESPYFAAAILQYLKAGKADR